MKKILLFILSLLFYLPLTAQISENEFPIIGYFDHYVHDRYSSYYGVGPNLDNFDWATYYESLEELGLTHLVTMGDDIPLNNGQGIEIIDNNILYGIGGVKIGDYAQAQGNEPTSFAYEVGGSNPASVWSEDENTENYGFGGNTGYYSKWIKSSLATTGNQNYEEEINGVSHTVAYADTTIDNQGILVSAELPSVHHFKDWNYYVMLVARIDPIPGGNPNDIVARINIDVTTTSVVTGQNHIFDYMPSGTPDSANYIQTKSFDVKASEFDGNNYTEIVKGTFGAGNKILKIEIEWMDKRNLYVDQLCVYDKYYKDLYVEPTSIENDIQSVFDTLTAVNHSNHEHFYIDEPTPIMYRAYNTVNTIAENSAQGKYINSATGSRRKHDAVFANAQRRLPYVLYDLYTIGDHFDSTSSTSSNSIQKAFDNLIYSGATGEYPTSNRGLRTGIEWAQDFGGTDSRVPFYMTIQVQAENYVKNGQIVTPIYRAPRPNEILAEGNLSLCYGAKGIMYFIIGTFTPKATDSARAYYGLFDDTLSVYDGTNGIIQNPKHDQVPNDRYYAVQELNQHITNISGTLLDLTWKNAYSIHNGQPSGQYITSVSTSDASAETFVELGLFSNSTDNLDYFYVVNRRVLSTESRDVEITLNESGYATWRISEIGTNNSWIVSNTGNFTTNYQPGEGKLFKLEPMFEGSSETLSGNVAVSCNLTISSGKTLIIRSGSQLAFASGKGIIVDGTLNATNTTFTSSGSSWSGIQFRSGSSGILDGCTIENVYTYGGAAISMIGGGYATVKNCIIKDNSISHGISIINSGSTAPYLFNNTIRNNTQSGIYIYHGNAYLRYNTITGPSSSNHAGVKSDYFSTPLFAAPSGGYEEGWNTIQNGYHGLWGIYHCNINAGGRSNGYNNTFSNNTYANVRASSYTTIYAKKNWWSPNPPSRVITDGTSSIDYTPYNSDQTLTTEDGRKNSSSVSTTGSLLSQARDQMKQKNYQQAFNLYQQIINSKISESEVMLAISDLYFLYKAYSIPGVLTLLESITSSKENVNEYKPLALEVISNLSLYDKSEPDFLLFNTKLREYSRNTIHELHGIVDLFYYHFNKKEFDEALKVIESVSEKFLEEDNVKFAQWLINSELGIESSSTSKLGNGITSAEDDSKPKEFRLFGNYPNPFNPTTKISFSIPVQNQVELAVYDVLGRKVAEVINEVLNAGEYDIEFDGSSLASGLYIYKLTSGNFTVSKKMMIVK